MRAPRLALPLLALLSCSCGGQEPEPGWRSLARGFSPTPIRAREAWGDSGPGRPPVFLVTREHETWAEVELPRAIWTPIAARVWTAPLPLVGRAGKVPAVLEINGKGVKPLASPKLGRMIRILAADDSLGDLGALLGDIKGPSAFGIDGTEVVLVRGENDPPPETCLLRQAVGGGESVDGVWRVQIGSVVADGLPVISGRSETVVADVPSDSILHIQTASIGRGGEDDDELVFRISIDGELLLEHRQAIQPELELEAHRLELPARGRKGASLRFEVQGPVASSAFLTPTIAPAAASSTTPRPGEDRHPDIFFFMADTYRADNLAAWGGRPELTPNLNRLAEGGVRFLWARCAATWTLPSHAALFAGLYPHQADVTRSVHSLSPDVVTLAENLRDGGYRTAAVTERGFVSHSYGLDQGFEWFYEGPLDFEHTQRMVRWQLGLDDGRPLCLFIHSYRAHSPYRVSDETRARLTEDFEALGTYEELVKRLKNLGELDRSGRPVTGERAEILASLKTLYRGGSADVDVGYGALLDHLRELGRFDSSVVVFTSDHGEAFGEHGSFGHGQGVWEEEARVPLVVLAPGLGAREDRTPVSLVDLPPTVCRLVGIEPRPEWVGRDLFGSQSTPILSHQCGRGIPSQVGIFSGTRKIILRDRPGKPGHGQLRFAYDLGLDPGENRDVRSSSDWPTKMLESQADTLERASASIFESVRATVGADQQAELQGLGYGGGEADDG